MNAPTTPARWILFVGRPSSPKDMPDDGSAKGKPYKDERLESWKLARRRPPRTKRFSVWPLLRAAVLMRRDSPTNRQLDSPCRKLPQGPPTNTRAKTLASQRVHSLASSHDVVVRFEHHIVREAPMTIAMLNGRSRRDGQRR